MNIDHLNDGMAAAYRRAYKCAYADWLCAQDFNIGLTLNWNTDVGLEVARRDVGECFLIVDRRILGGRFNRMREGRAFGVFFFENLTTNLHCHGFVRVAPHNLSPFLDLFPADRGEVWSRVGKDL